MPSDPSGPFLVEELRQAIDRMALNKEASNAKRNTLCQQFNGRRVRVFKAAVKEANSPDDFEVISELGSTNFRCATSPNLPEDKRKRLEAKVNDFDNGQKIEIEGILIWPKYSDPMQLAVEDIDPPDLGI